MFFKFENGKDGIITLISFNIEKLDESVKAHLKESLKGKLKFDNDKATVKCSMTFEELETINKGYNEFHSRFILENIIPSKLQLKEEKKE